MDLARVLGLLVTALAPTIAAVAIGRRVGGWHGYAFAVVAAFGTAIVVGSVMTIGLGGSGRVEAAATATQVIGQG